MHLLFSYHKICTCYFHIFISCRTGKKFLKQFSQLFKTTCTAIQISKQDYNIRVQEGLHLISMSNYLSIHSPLYLSTCIEIITYTCNLYNKSKLFGKENINRDVFKSMRILLMVHVLLLTDLRKRSVRTAFRLPLHSVR